MSEEEKPPRPLTPAPHPSRPGRESAMQPDIEYIRERQMAVYRVRIHETGQYKIVKDSSMFAVEWRESDDDEWTRFDDRFRSVGGALDFLRVKGVERL